ncbi:histidine phosphatase family protein [Micromonospora sp. CPCC 206061]|uniref:histidine phosphatase family protein n=1 Tax=Micromonospora sp. CPCC 206061 TaxID=3122410 RepID=UPI002FF2DF3A
MGDIVLVRHGQTEWSLGHRHTSYTDIELTPDGERQARDLADRLAGWPFATVLSSPRKRALRTAELAKLAVTAVDDDLAEWNYGDYEGVTTDEIHRTRDPRWNLWTDGAPRGESPEQVGARLDRVLAHAKTFDGDVAIVGHAHALRVLGARWVGLPPSGGGLLRLDTATLSVLGHEHGRPVILRWNC